jgi:hypothetical protein
MKKAQIIIMVGLMSICSSSCEKLKRVTAFNMEVESYLTIQSEVGINLPFSVYSPDVQTNSEAEFEVNNTKAKKIEHIQLTALVMTILSPQNQEFDFLKEVEVFISADGLSEVNLASKYNIENSIGRELRLDVSMADFKEYLKCETFDIRVRSLTDEMFIHDVEIKILSEFRVDAKVVGFVN